MLNPGGPGWEKTVQMMREDLIDGRYTKIEMAARKLLKEQGRDFDSEFKKWRENNDRRIR